MASLFKSVFRSGKTAVLSPPAELSSDLSLAPPTSSGSGAAATAPATEPAVPAANDPAVLQEFLLKNFLLAEQPAETRDTRASASLSVHS